MTTNTILNQVDDFMQSIEHNRWLSDDILHIYVRKGIHYIDSQIVNTFDVANIETIPEQYKGQGYFKDFMIKVESLGLPVFVESIQSSELVTMLVKNGYTMVGLNAIKYPITTQSESADIEDDTTTEFDDFEIQRYQDRKILEIINGL